MGSFLLFIIVKVIDLLILAIVVNVILSWLVAFEIINLRNPFARQVLSFLDAVTRPLLAPFRRIVPLLGGMDVSPIIACLVLEGLELYLIPWLFRPIIAIIG